MEFQYETLGNTSYLVASFEGGKGIINYQLQMLVNNDIKNVAKANKRQKNDDVIISYDITSRTALAKMDSKQKIPKLGLINIIQGALATLVDIEEYQLANSGIVFDEEYIFVNPVSYEPTFIYVPNSMEEGGIESLKKFILSLIMSSKVEMTSDNFVQSLIDALNNPTISTKDLYKLCEECKSGKGGETIKSVPQESSAYSPSQQINTPAVAKTPVPQQINTPVVAKTPLPQQPTPIPDTKPKPTATVEKEDKKTEKKAKGGSSSSKTVFILLQLAFVLVTLAVILSGVLNNPDGSLNITYVFGIIVALAGADFVIYREMFVNKKSKSDSNKKEVKSDKKTSKPAVSIPGKDIPAKPVIPGKEIPTQPVVPPKETSQLPSENNPSQKNNYFVFNNVCPINTPQEDKPQPVVQSVPTSPTPPMERYPQISDLASEDTVVMDDSGAYLEFFENGLSTKIHLSKDSIVVGKLRNGCDFVINNNKISKIHAEFITRGTDYFVKDNNSTNGTYINGSEERIQSNVEYQIFKGDTITLANVDMTFKC